MTHRTITPEDGSRILLSAATNGDHVSDVVALTAMTAVETQTPVHTLTSVLVLEQHGSKVDEDGYIVETVR